MIGVKVGSWFGLCVCKTHHDSAGNVLQGVKQEECVSGLLGGGLVGHDG